MPFQKHPGIPPISRFGMRPRVFKEQIEFWPDANVIRAHIMFTKFRNADSERIFSESFSSLDTVAGTISKPLLSARTRVKSGDGKRQKSVRRIRRNLPYPAVIAAIYVHARIRGIPT